MELIQGRELLVAKLREPVPDDIHGFHPDARSVAAADAIETYHRAWTSECEQHAACRKRAGDAEAKLIGANDRIDRLERELEVLRELARDYDDRMAD